MTYSSMIAGPVTAGHHVGFAHVSQRRGSVGTTLVLGRMDTQTAEFAMPSECVSPDVHANALYK
jgi:hypothetical protein